MVSSTVFAVSIILQWEWHETTNETSFTEQTRKGMAIRSFYHDMLMFLLHDSSLKTTILCVLENNNICGWHVNIEYVQDYCVLTSPCHPSALPYTYLQKQNTKIEMPMNKMWNVIFTKILSQNE